MPRPSRRILAGARLSIRVPTQTRAMVILSVIPMWTERMRRNSSQTLAGAN
jgi:hypothetical protein